MNTALHLRKPKAVSRRVAVIALSLVLAAAGTALAKPGEGSEKGKGKGKGKGQSADFVPPGLADKAVPPGHRRAPVEVVVTKAPPPLRVEVVAARPSPRHLWVPGFWMWEADAYVWYPGVWMLPPEPAAIWVAPRYETRSSVSIFISGYWKL